MKPILIAGTSIVNLALISYTLFIISERKTGKAGKRVLFFLTLGVILDITATSCMIAGSSNSPFTFHGVIGYSSLLGMLADALLIWRGRQRKGLNSVVPESLHKYSFVAYCWWLTAYITGALIVMLK